MHIEVWNTVLIQRAIDAILLKERKQNPDIREIIVYGKDYLSYVTFTKLWKKISKTAIVEIKDSDKDSIRDYVLDVAKILSSHIDSFEKTTRNVFQNAGDTEGLHDLIKALIE